MTARTFPGDILQISDVSLIPLNYVLTGYVLSDAQSIRLVVHVCTLSRFSRVRLCVTL